MGTSTDLVAHMRAVQAAERDLHDLGLWWQMIESSAAISCPDAVGHILPTLVRTRERFVALRSHLVERMAGEHHAALGDDLLAKAQCTIDILVRNLFERTADVGFLATDEPLRAFCSLNAGERDRQRPALVERLRDYRSKYTVYDDILLIGTDGTVLARLDEQPCPERTSDPMIAAALAASGYVERYASSDLVAGGQPALLYAHRIPGVGGSSPVGVLVLRFRFADEMARIFSGMADEAREVAILLVDDQDRVAASNDEAHVPIGAQLRRLPPGEVALTAFGGREYLAVASATHGYQGYTGPGWRAQAMISLLTAFRSSETPATGDETHVPLDNPELATICLDADAINRDLRRAVWNGRLGQREDSADGRRMKAVLTQVNQAGHRTRERVDRAIRELYDTSIARIRRQAMDLARLAITIMDRNLYERANDCRWWALSPTMCRELAQPPSAAGTAALNAELERINNLYTVYSRLVVFDAEGIIRGASGQGHAELLGQPVDPRWLEAVRALTGGQHYAVTDFQPCPLHDGGDTYVYMAAMRAAGTEARFIGGIAAIFHSRREFETMLREVLGARTGMAGFIDANGRVLAATDTALAHADFANVPPGPTVLITHAGVHYACARVKADGYREFKTSDGYDNHVDALVALRLGAQERRRASLADQRLEPVHPGEPRTEMAVCQVGPARYAISTDSVLEALPQAGLVRTPSNHPLSVGLLEVPGGRLVPVLCARRMFGLSYPPRATDGLVLVLRSPDRVTPVLGLRVDDVITVLSVQQDSVHPPPAAFTSGSYVGGLIDCRIADLGDAALIQVLDAPRVLALLPRGADQREG